MKSPIKRSYGFIDIVAIFFAGTSLVSTTSADTSSGTTESYSPNVGHEAKQVYWGDLHLHTTNSVDAYAFGSRIDRDAAYRFARGEEIKATNGARVKLKQPLDFLAITDHGEYMGLMRAIEDRNPLLANVPIIQRFRDLLAEGRAREVIDEWGKYRSEANAPSLVTPEFTRSVWLDVAREADRYNTPGHFTAFVAYEWSPSWDGGSQHRNIIFRDGADQAGNILPFTATDSKKPEDLWKFLDQYEAEGDRKVLAIPHNSNLSGGHMFSPEDSYGKPFTEDYVKNQSRWEPTVEVTQYKGDSESHPYLSPNDKFSDYGSWDWSNSSGTEAHRDSWFKGNYVREALKTGLVEEARLGVNPFKFGLIGSSDSHTGLATSEEDNWWGKFDRFGPSAQRLTMRTGEEGQGYIVFGVWRFLSSGMAAIWAQENTRESLFDAIKRREVYATTGPRITLRFFGGWAFDELDHTRPDYAAIGYDKGVPMGGDLVSSPDGRAPRFMIVAAKDPQGANLERIQVVKGWLNDQGEAQEKVWDVMLSDKRKPGKKMLPPIKSTVDIKTASYTNTVGEVQLATVWQDPDFNPDQRAFYYVRVLEIPTPRWTTYDATFYGLELPKDVPAIHQERAYSSPIWYSPLAKAGGE